MRRVGSGPTYARDQFARAVATHNANLATLNAYPMPEEARQAIEIEIFARRSRPRSSRRSGLPRTAAGSSEDAGRAVGGRSGDIGPGQKPAKGHRGPPRAIWAFCKNKKRKWPYDMPELAGRLVDELGNVDGKKRTRATLRKLYDRDLMSWLETQQRSVSD